MRRFFPPWPWKNKASGKNKASKKNKAAELDDYERALLARFRPGSYEVKEQATASAVLAEELIAKFERALTAMAPSDAGRKPLQDLIELLKAARATAQSIEARWNTEFRPAEDAAQYVSGALDLQVGKAGGMLAFDGLIIAVAVLLWTNRTLPPWFGVLEVILFVLLLTSSLLSLAAIWAWWGRADNYASPQTGLKTSLQLAALRSWAGNLATFAAFVATILVAIGVFASGPPGSTRVKLDHPGREFRLPVTLDDTLRLRCEEIEGPPRPRGAVDVDRLSCTLSR